MERHIFILGNNPKLSQAELRAVLPRVKFVEETDHYIMAEGADIDCGVFLRQLGGTVKIGKVIHDSFDKGAIINDLLAEPAGKKILFGISDYKKNSKLDIHGLGMEIKKALKERGRNARFVTSMEPVLSSVVVAKNKCREFLILGNETIAKTCAVQEFEEYSERDYGRPRRDARSGMIPPKLAKIMINLADAQADKILLDPFCGSGTILQEAILLGYKNIIGCDISKRAVEDTKKNLEWLAKSYRLPVTSYKNLQLTTYNLQLFCCDIHQLPKFVKKADVIVTEPYLGPALKGYETIKQINAVVDELEELYIDSFKEFFKILPSGSRVVIVFPAWRFEKDLIHLKIEKDIENIGFVKVNKNELLYSRPDHRVMREIVIWGKRREE